MGSKITTEVTHILLHVLIFSLKSLSRNQRHKPRSLNWKLLLTDVVFSFQSKEFKNYSKKGEKFKFLFHKW